MSLPACSSVSKQQLRKVPGSLLCPHLSDVVPHAAASKPSVLQVQPCPSPTGDNPGTSATWSTAPVLGAAAGHRHRLGLQIQPQRLTGDVLSTAEEQHRDKFPGAELVSWKAGPRGEGKAGGN